MAIATDDDGVVHTVFDTEEIVFSEQNRFFGICAYDSNAQPTVETGKRNTLFCYHL